LSEEQLRVLKAMNEITKRVDLAEFAGMVDLTSDEAMEAVRELIRAGYVRSTGTGYGVTEKGRTALKAIAAVPDGMEFTFYAEVGQPTEFVARSLKEFFEVVKTISAKSLEFHVYRGDFENWIGTAVGDSGFADEIAELRMAELKGEELRKEIVKAAGARFSLG
jgi:Mn-dependent DtxR family transcriptional regulator